MVDGGELFDIVVVCNGNRFRSPLAEGVLRSASKALPVRVRSVGTLDLPPGPALPEAIAFGRSVGLDLERHRSRRLADDDLSDADLVLGFELNHVARAVVDAHARRERTFLLFELANALSEVETPDDTDAVARARRAVSLANEHRSRGLQEIPDPSGGPAAGYARAGEQVRTAATRVAEALFGRSL